MKYFMNLSLRLLAAYFLLVSPALAKTFTWTGMLNADWFAPANWNVDTLPYTPITSNDNVVIALVYPRPYPIIEGPTATIEMNNFTIEFCAACTLSNVASPTILVHGNMINAGYFENRTTNTSPEPTVNGMLVNASSAAFINNNNCEFTVMGSLMNANDFLNEGQLNVYGNMGSNTENMGDGTFSLLGVNQALTSPVVTDGLVEVFSNLTTNGHLFLLTNGQLMHGDNTISGNMGNVNGNITIQRRGNSGTGIVWNYWGSPVSGAFATSLGSMPYYFDPASATDPVSTAGLQAGWKPASGALDIGKGYISYSGGLKLTGTVSSWNTVPDATVPVVDGVAPFNFLGNPFPSAMDAATFMAANAGILTGDIWFWDDDGTGGSGYSSSDFAVWNGLGGTAGPNNPAKVPNGSIVTGQGFFVEAIADGDVHFNNNMRDPSGGNTQFFKKAPIERLWVNVTNTHGLYNEVLIGFLPTATEGYDMGFDSRKRRGNPNIALYTKANQEDFAIQALPELTEERIVELGLDAGLTGTHTLSLKQVENLDETVVILLEDRLTGTWQNLRMNASYDFTVATAGTIAGRFFLHFNPALQIDATVESCDGGDASITLVQDGAPYWNYTLTDASGNEIDSDAAFYGTATMNYLAGGDYTLQLSDTFGYVVTKTITVDAKQKVTAEFVPSADAAFENELITFINSSAGATQFEWDFGDGSPVSTDANPVHQYAAAGTYYVQLHAWNEDCAHHYDYTMTVQKLSTGIHAAGENSISVYTFDKTLNLKFNFQKEEKAQLTVYDVLGKMIFSGNVNTNGSYEIELENAAAGNYLVQVVTEGKVLTRKVHIGN